MLAIHRSANDPRQGRTKRIIAILALAAAAGAARGTSAQVVVPPPTTGTTTSLGASIAQSLQGLVTPPLEALGTLAEIATDETKLLPCTLADVAGEFSRLAATGVLQMATLPCEAWVRLSIRDAYNDNEVDALKAGAGAPTVAFALSPREAEALRSSGVATGEAVSLNDLVSAVALGPRTPGFGGATGRISRRTSETMEAAMMDAVSSFTGSQAQKARGGELSRAAKLVDGGRAFPSETLYAPLALSPSAVAAKVGDLNPNGAIVVLTAVEGVPVAGGIKSGVALPPPKNSVSVDLTAGGAGGAGGTFGLFPTLSVSSSGKLSDLPAEQEVMWAPVGGSDPDLPTKVVTAGTAVTSLHVLG